MSISPPRKRLASLLERIYEIDPGANDSDLAMGFIFEKIEALANGGTIDTQDHHTLTALLESYNCQQIAWPDEWQELKDLICNHAADFIGPTHSTPSSYIHTPHSLHRARTANDDCSPKK